MSSASELSASILSLIAGARNCEKPSAPEGCIVVRAVHTICGQLCSKAVILEVWRVYVEQSSEALNCVDPFFLQAAVRSKLHFAPLNAVKTQLSEHVTFCGTFEPESSQNCCLPEIHEFRPSVPMASFRCRVVIFRTPQPEFDFETACSLSKTERPRSLELREPSVMPPSSSQRTQLSPDASPSSKKSRLQSSNSPCKILISDMADAKSPLPLPTPIKAHFGKTPVQKKRHLSESSAVASTTCCATSNLFCNSARNLRSSPAPPKTLKRRRHTSVCTAEELAGKSSSSFGRGLLGSFEESALNLRLYPIAELSGFTAKLFANNGPVPAVNLELRVKAFCLDTENAAPAPYLGVCPFGACYKRGLKIPVSGVLQLTLFNTQGTVVKMFVQRYDLSSMPPKSQTFLRQRTFLMRKNGAHEEKKLRYLVHFKIRRDSAGNIRLHRDIRLLFSLSNTVETNFETPNESEQCTLEVFTEMPPFSQ